MKRWTINDVDITDEFGLLVKKGSYSNLLKYSDAKEYLTENVRDEDGERAFLAYPHIEARDVELTFFVMAQGDEDFFVKRDNFLRFMLREGRLQFRMERHNRSHLLYYKSCKSYKSLSGSLSPTKEVWYEFSITFREPNPNTILKRDVLELEAGGNVQYESGEDITIETI